MTAITSEQRLHLKRLIIELKLHKAPHTEFVSVYIPAGYELSKITNHLAEEQGTASNIKSAVTRKNVQMALEKMIQHLRLFKNTPANGLAVFTGNVAASEGKQDMRVWSIEPPMPLNIRIYRCDKAFVTDILEDMMAIKDVYGLVVLDHRDASIALLRGKTITTLVQTHSEVPGKFRAGGQCLATDTLIYSSDGNISPINNLPESTLKSANFDELTLINTPITSKWETKKTQLYTIITKHPRLTINSSPEHTFFVVADGKVTEKKARDLISTDLLAMPEKINVNGQIQFLNPKKYYNTFEITENGRSLLLKARTKQNLHQKELATKINVTQTTISSYELGKLHANREPLQHLCSALNINFPDFLSKHTMPVFYSLIKLPLVLDKQFAQFLGYFTGDGGIEEDRITLFEQDKEVAFNYKQTFDKYFEHESSYTFRESKNYHQLRYTSRPLIRLIRGEFPEICKNNKTFTSTIPKRILISPNNVLAGFLKGLFDAEGYVSGRKIGFGINNKILAQQVQMALLRFGILSSLLEYDNRKNPYSKNMRYTIEISEKTSLQYFKERIGFTGAIKSKKLEQTIANKTTRGYVRQLIIPGRAIRTIIEKAGYNLQLFPQVTNFFRNERMMSKEVFNNSILAMVKDNKLKMELQKVVDIPLLPVQIGKISSSLKETLMMDISVMSQNFIANGLFVHNSAPRFARARELANKGHYKKIADYMMEQFLPLGNNLKGIIIGGPGVTVNDFMHHDYVTGDLKKKILGTKDLSYTGDFGLQELLDRSSDLLEAEEVAQEKKLMERFFKQLLDNPGKVTYGEKETLRALDMNAVDLLLVSESIPEERIFELEEIAAKGGTTLKVVSTETREGVQLKEMGGIAALLRFEIG